MPVTKKPKVGEEIESMCNKCKEPRVHTVVALPPGKVPRVECQTCHGQHNFVSPVKAAAAKVKKESAPKAVKLTEGERTRQTAATEWRNAVDGVAAEKFKPYQISGVYQEKDLISHPSFGRGEVKAVTSSGKMEVLFQDAVRRLVFNRKPSR